uniref:NR LBD domain-containing protein n=1 Tax=Caenorhabditis tropicalis TaxID=1561998 RepID=A0A1I7UWH3_9PELO
MDVGSDLESPTNQFCKVCDRKAYGRHYGVISCDACKMFFRRVYLGNMLYSCRRLGNCFNTPSISRPWKCQSCRYKRCIDNGMEFVASSPPVTEVIDTKFKKLEKMLGELRLKDIDRQAKLSSFYSLDDPCLEDVLKDPMAAPNHVVDPHEWAFLALFSHMKYFMDFKFVQNLSKIIFQFSTLKLTYFCGLMRTLNEKRMKMLNPGGQEIYPDDLIVHYRSTPYSLARICSEPVDRMIEWRITNEEFYLLNLIFFCNPAIPGISNTTQMSLTRKRNKYSGALFHYCQIKYQQSAPSRLADLYSLYGIITTNAQQMENLFYMFNFNTPEFKFRNLVTDLFHL